MGNFKDTLNRRLVKGSRLTKEEFDQNMDLIGNQIDKWEAMDVAPPAASWESGEKGDVIYDSDFMYICVADDTWRRVLLQDFPLIPPLFASLTFLFGKFNIAVSAEGDVSTYQIYEDGIPVGNTISKTGLGSYAINGTTSVGKTYTAVATLNDLTTHSSSIDGVTLVT